MIYSDKKDATVNVTRINVLEIPKSTVQSQQNSDVVKLEEQPEMLTMDVFIGHAVQKLNKFSI